MLHDAILALRRLRNAPSFTVVAIVTLALAIGANTATFSVADVVIFRPLPYANPEHVYVLQLRNAKSEERSRAVPFEYLQLIDEHHRGLGEVGLRGPTMMTIHGADHEAEWMETLAVTPSYFRVLGVRAVLGRLFDNGDAADPGRAAVLSYETWQRRFAGDENIVGRAVKLGTRTRLIIGVLPRDFVFPATSLQFQFSPTGRPEYLTVARPLARDSGATSLARRFTDDAIVRLERGVTREQAEAEIEALVAPSRARRRQGNDTVVLESPRAVLFPAGRPIMSFLVAAAALVLLIGCGNLASLLLARTGRREREIALYAALGATPLRIVRPIFFETLIVGIAAALLSLVVTALTFDLLLRQVPATAYGSAAVRLDMRVGVFTMALGILGGFVFALAPAWRSALLDVQPTLSEGHAHARRRRRASGYPTIAAQVALSMVLVSGAAIAARAFVSVLRVPLGFSPDGLIAIYVRPEGSSNPDLFHFYERAVETLARRADVIAAGAGSAIPTDGFGRAEAVEVSHGQPAVDILYVLPGYFETLGVRLVRGRLLTGKDIRSDLVVLSESAADTLFPDQDPIGAVVRGKQGRQLTVVGVVGDVQRSLSLELSPPAYVIPPEDMTRGMTIVARMRRRGPDTLEAVRREIVALAPETPVTAVWWSDSIDRLPPYRNSRFQTLVLGTFAGLALALTALGVFSSMALTVAARTREMGVRLALGATPVSLVNLVVRQAATPVVAGIILGLIAAHWLRRIAEAHLFKVDVRDPFMMAAAAITVAAAAFVAAYWPARHASRVDPIVVLRAE
jgi:putative ABC transport system permease protein